MPLFTVPVQTTVSMLPLIPTDKLAISAAAGPPVYSAIATATPKASAFIALSLMCLRPYQVYINPTLTAVGDEVSANSHARVSPPHTTPPFFRNKQWGSSE